MRSIAVAALLITAGAAQAQVTLSDRNSTAIFNNSGGQVSWTVNGVQQIFQQSFFLRFAGQATSFLNSYPQAFINAVDTNGRPGLDTLVQEFNAGPLVVDVSYSLRGGFPGSGSSDLGEQIGIYNASNAPVSFSFFQYVDFDLNATNSNDIGSLINGNTVRQTDGGSLTVSETVVTPPANFFDVGTISYVGINVNNGQLLNQPAAGPADIAWAFQWNITLNPGDSFQISKDKQITGVPTPGAVAVLGLGALAARRRRA